MPSFHVVADVSSDDPGALRPVLEEFVSGALTELPEGFHIDGVAAGDDVRHANRALLSALRRAERRTRMRAEWADGDVVHRFFDYVPKGTRPAAQGTGQ